MTFDETEKDDNQVIPRWMTYLGSLNADEFGRLAQEKSVRSIAPTFALELEAFYRNPSPRIGADLFERALVMELYDESLTLAEYVQNQKTISGLLRRAAQRRISGEAMSDETDYRIAIGAHRRALKENPRNPIRWAELARLYTITSNDSRAIAAVRTALQLSPSNRYVVRGAIRLFIHLRDFDELALLAVKYGNSIDPWIKGVAISAALLAGKSPKRNIVPEAKNIRPESVFDNSEFLAACGMLEYRNGKRQQARSLFSSAWKDPSGNVTSHAEWVTRAVFPGLRPELSSFRRPTPEALAGVAYTQSDWGRMQQAITDWSLQEPYSRRPFRFIANVENLRGRHAEAIRWVTEATKIGRLDFGLSISKAYALLCLGRLKEAKAFLSQIEVPRTGSVNRCILIANWGLLALLSGEKKIGDECYARAHREGARISIQFRDRVFLNHVIAKRLSNAEISEDELLRVKAIASENQSNMDVQLIGRRALYAKPIDVDKCDPIALPEPTLIDCQP